MSKLKYILFTFTSAVILWNCASMQTPSGGEKDTEPPRVLYSQPIQGATNVHTKRIEIHFDEFFTLKNLQNELLISPPLDKTPQISQKGKSLFIELYEELKTNSTYTFNFGKGIVDYNEGNVLKDYSLVFSTGTELDSLSVSGQLFPCRENKLPENSIVGLYEKDSLLRDSTIYLTKPDYFGLVDANGYFQIDHIREGFFEIIAFEDVNANYKYDGSTEQIAYQDSLVDTRDSSQIELWIFKEISERKLLDIKAKNSGRIHWAYNKNIDSAIVHANQELDFIFKTEKDSLFVWPLSYPTDSFYLWAKTDGRIDSILVKPDTLQKQNLHLSLIDSYVKKNEQLIIHSDAPIQHVDTSKVQLMSDSTSINYSLTFNNFEFFFEFKHNGNQSFDLIFDKGAVLDHYNNSNDSTHFSFYTKDENALAGLKINLLNPAEHYFFELLKDGEVIDRININENLVFSELLPSKYQLRLTIDTNSDGKWTEGNYLKNTKAEKVFYFPEELNLRANWELEIDFSTN